MTRADEQQQGGERPSGAGRSEEARARDQARNRRDQDEYDEREEQARDPARSRRDQDEYDERDEPDSRRDPAR